MEKNQIIELRIDDMLDDGRAFGRYEGFAVFVSGGAVPGDMVKAMVTKVGKTSSEAALEEIVNPSGDRIKASCPFFGECGGCTMQELDYEAQKKIKTDQLRAKLTRLGGLEDPKVNEMLGAETLKYYRNKAVFAVGPHGEVGFKRAKSAHVIDIDDCMLQSDAAMVCADALRCFLRETGVRCISQMTVRTAFNTGEVMVIFEMGDPAMAHKSDTRKRGKKGKPDRKADTIPQEIPQIGKIIEMLDDAVYSLNEQLDTDLEITDAEEKNTGQSVPSYSLESVAVIRNGKCRIAAGKPTITEVFTNADGREISYEISPQSFFQVNPGQMEKLYDKAAEYAGLLPAAAGNDTADKANHSDTSDERLINKALKAEEGSSKVVLDLYCGAGTIGIWLLDRLRREDPELFERTKVIGIESVKPAVIDANRNSVINGLINTRYFCGKAEEELPGMMGLAKLYKWNEVNERVGREPELRIGRAGSNQQYEGKLYAEKIDVAILDPPRAGCGEALLAAVVTASPDRIVYVSCDPGTLARDIKFLCANGYEFVEATPIDQFPWTSHIECVCLLSNKKAKPMDYVQINDY